MKTDTIIKTFKLLALLVIVVVISTNCSLSENKKGYHIDPPIREDIWKKTSDFCTSIIENRFNETKLLLSDSLLKNSNELELHDLFLVFQHTLINYKFYSQNSYHQKNLLNDYWVRTTFNDPEIREFHIKYSPKTKETAITTAILEKGENKKLLTTIFGRHSGTLKIDYVFLGWLMIDGKDAFDWLKEAEGWIKKEDYVMANHCIQLSYWLLTPAAGIWKYQGEPRLLDTTQYLNRLINRELQFASPINSIKTNPKILELYPIMSFDTVYPGVTYSSNVPISDSVGITEECSKLDWIFAEYYKNIDSKSIFIKVVNSDDPWKEPDNFFLLKRKLIKMKNTNK